MVLRYRAGEAEPRSEIRSGIRNVWLGNGPGKCSDRQNRMDDFLVPQEMAATLCPSKRVYEKEKTWRKATKYQYDSKFVEP